MLSNTTRNNCHPYGMSPALQTSKPRQPKRCGRSLKVVRFVHALPGPGWTTSFSGGSFNLNATDKSAWGPDFGTLDSAWIDDVLISDDVAFVEQQPAQVLIGDATDRYATDTCYGMV